MTFRAHNSIDFLVGNGAAIASAARARDNSRAAGFLSPPVSLSNLY